MTIQDLIVRTLRIGVTVACVIAFIGGIIYLVNHGSEPFELERYLHFSYSDPHSPAFTTVGGIFDGFLGFTAVGWIQMGVLVLILTPVMRVLLSMFDFLRERDWLYALICAVVLAVIISNSLEGMA